MTAAYRAENNYIGGDEKHRNCAHVNVLWGAKVTN